MSLRLKEADDIASCVIACCRRNKFAPITVNVLDQSGIVIVCKRMDGCAPVGIPDFSFAKGFACVATKDSSRAFREKYAKEMKGGPLFKSLKLDMNPSKFC